MFKWPNLKVLVMGLGLHGGALAVARFLAEEGADIVVTDIEDARELEPSIRKLTKYKNVRFHLGGHRKEDLSWAELIVPNPAVPLSSPYLAYGKERGARILNEAALFLLLSKRPIIGVTGTRGKSTTASLIHHVLKKRYPRTLLAGNIRDTVMFDVVRDAMKKAVDPIVLELSSWHLEGLADIRMSPESAVITNLYPDHLNRYRTLRDYYRAKSYIFRYQKSRDKLFLNYDSKSVRSLSRRSRSQKFWFSLDGKLPGRGATIIGDTIVFQETRKVTELLRCSDLPLVGEHNLLNTLAAVAVAYTWGIRANAMKQALRSFKTLKGREELVAVKRGIYFYNDTNATTPEATIALLKTIPGPIVLILGGEDKRLMYHSLALELLGRAKGVVFLPGTATEKLKKELKRYKPGSLIMKDAPNLRRALATALHIAKPGDAVALSPAAASFGLFEHEFDRGDQFIRAVRSL